MRSLVLAAILLAAASRAPAQRGPAPIDSMSLRAHTWFLAHDLLQGRGTGTHGADVAGRYLAAAAEQLGLEGAGPGRSFLQPVPLVEALLDPARQAFTLTETDSAGRAVRDARVRPDLFLYNVGTARTLVPIAGEVAFVGTAAGILARPAALPDVRGKVALLRGMFGAEAAAADTLRHRGATGVIHLVGNPDLFQLYVQSRGASRLYIAPEANAVHSFIPDIPAVIVHPALEAVLLNGVPGSGDDPPAPVPGRRVRIAADVTTRPVAAHNVAAILRGRDAARREEFIVFTAHYDHLGFSTPDARGDSLYNGFSDNAAGSAMLLAIAQALAAEGTRRSILFLWLTGEERGLLGSDYFVAHPLVRTEQIVGVINLDAGAPPAPNRAWRIAGGPQSTLGDLAVQVAQAAGWDATTSPATPNSDYYPFLRVGIPAVFLVPGAGPFEGLTTDASDALRQQWDHYHQASDHWAADYPFGGLVRYADYARRVARALDAAPRPVMR